MSLPVRRTKLQGDERMALASFTGPIREYDEHSCYSPEYSQAAIVEFRPLPVFAPIHEVLEQEGQHGFARAALTDGRASAKSGARFPPSEPAGSHSACR